MLLSSDSRHKERKIVMANRKFSASAAAAAHVVLCCVHLMKRSLALLWFISKLNIVVVAHSLSLSLSPYSLFLTCPHSLTHSYNLWKKFPRSILIIAPSQTWHISIKVDLIRTRFNSKNSCQLAPSHLYILQKNYITMILIESGQSFYFSLSEIKVHKRSNK